MNNMATIDTEKDPFEALDKCIQQLRERGDKLKNRQFPKDEAPKKGEEKKKELTNVKKNYIIFFKAASIIGLVFVVSIGLSALSLPNFYAVVIAFLESLNPLNSVGMTPDLDHYVNILK
jgi:hypothetical protein